MNFRKVGALAGAFVAAGLLGCASQKSTTPGKSDTAAQEQAAAAATRDEFMRQGRAWLDELNDAIVVLAVKVHDFGDEPQQAQWGELLYQLKEERNRLDAALIEARDVDPQLWEARQEQLRQELRRLESAIDQTALAIIHDLAGGSRSAAAEPSAGPSEVDLCHVQVQGTDAEVEQDGELLLVHLSARNSEAVAALKQRAEQELLRLASTPPSSEPQAPPGGNEAPAAPKGNESNRAPAAPNAEGAGNAAGLPAAQLQVSETPNGVVFIFLPLEGQEAELRARLETAAEQIEQRRC